MAIPTLAMIPSGYKAGKLYSVLPSDGTGDFTVARNSVATRVNQSGLIEEVGVNVPRLDYSAGGCPVLLTEIQSQNLITYSEDFSQSYWTKSGPTLAYNQGLSPDGLNNATKMIPSTSSTSQDIFATATALGSTAYTRSFFAKSDGYNWINIQQFDGLTNSGAWFDLSTGSLGITQTNVTSSIKHYGNDWYKCSVTFTTQSGASSERAQIKVVGGDGSSTFAGNGTDGVLIWGAQLEQQPAATSYIKSNSGSATTRVADLVTGAGSAATFNSLEHTFFVDLNSVFESSLFSAISILGSTSTLSDNRIMILKETNNTQVRLQIRSGGATTAIETLSNIDFSIRQKLAVTVKENEVKYYRNGFLVATDTGTIPLPVGLGQLALNGGNPNDNFFASTKDIRYYNQVLTAAETLELMSYDSFNEMASALQYTIK